MAIKCKFLIQSKTKTVGYTPNGASGMVPQYRITGIPVHVGSPENEEYFLATPSGTLDLQVLNKKAADQIEPGDQVYVTIEKAN